MGYQGRTPAYFVMIAAAYTSGCASDLERRLGEVEGVASTNSTTHVNVDRRLQTLEGSPGYQAGRDQAEVDGRQNRRLHSIAATGSDTQTLARRALGTVEGIRDRVSQIGEAQRRLGNLFLGQQRYLELNREWSQRGSEASRTFRSAEQEAYNRLIGSDFYAQTPEEQLRRLNAYDTELQRLSEANLEAHESNGSRPRVPTPNPDSDQPRVEPRPRHEQRRLGKGRLRKKPPSTRPSKKKKKKERKSSNKPRWIGMFRR